MAKLSLKAGTTSKIAYVFIQDSAVATGAGKAGLAYNTATWIASYVRPGAARAAITLVTQTVAGTYSSGGFVEVDATNMIGVYRLDIPNAALAAGVGSVIITLQGAAGAAPCVLEIELTAVDNQDATKFGMTRVVANADQIGGTAQTGRDIGASVIAASVTGNVGGSVASVTGAVGSVTGAVGSVTAGVTVTTNNDKTGYGLSAAAVQAIWDAATAALTTVGSIGKKLADWVIGTSQTGDSFARLGAPAGASVSADVAAVKVNTAAILVDTAEIGVAGAGLTAADDAVIAAIAALNNVSTASVTTAVWAQAMSDLAAVPGATGSVLAGINWLFELARNKRTQTATTELVMKDDGTTTLGTSTKSDSLGTFTRGEYA